MKQPAAILEIPVLSVPPYNFELEFFVIFCSVFNAQILKVCILTGFRLLKNHKMIYS
jgi:hypothetical protein